MAYTAPLQTRTRTTTLLGVAALIAAGIMLVGIASRRDEAAIVAAILFVLLGWAYHVRWSAAWREQLILDLLRCGGWWTAEELIYRSHGTLSGDDKNAIVRIAAQGLICTRIQKSASGEQLTTYAGFISTREDTP